MKKIGKLVICGLLPLLLLGDEDPIASYSYWDFHPLHIGDNMIRIGGASVDSDDYNGHLYFRKNSAYLNMLVPISRDSYFFPRVEFWILVPV